ncbi:DNA-dependent protein kinase catalytic subunit-like isoform X2 [Paramacrobiotus metropolitanus]|nr:DNA-dependent protein kinase catalytic subunit-like isoform X2 [Paramacrobiotus metropolitanus]
MDVIVTSCRKIIHAREVSRYAMVVSALKLISQHRGLLVPHFLAKQEMYTEIYCDLSYWAAHPANRDVQKQGSRTLDDYLRECGRSVAAGSKLKNRVENAKLAYDFFIQEFDSKIKEAKGYRNLTLAVRGYGYFAAATVELASRETIDRMFTEMIYKSEQMFFTSNSESTDDKLANLPGFIESLSIMIKDGETGLPDTFQPAVQRLCILLMDMFPKLGLPHQHLACKAVVKLFLVASHSSTYAGEFISEIIYQGVIRSCSYPVPVDSLESEISGVRKPPKPTNFKDFFPLWEKLVNCTYMKDVLNDFGISEMDLLGVSRLIFTDLLAAAARIMDSLNLQLLSTVPEDDSIAVDVIAVDKAPLKEQDFQIFFSLEQIIKNTVSKAKVDVLSTGTNEICHKIISMSDRHPLVPGLYRFLSVFWNCDRRLKLIPSLMDEEMDTDVIMTEEPSPTSEPSNRTAAFVAKVTGRVQHFFGDLLVSALCAVLDAPENALIEVLKENRMILDQPLFLALQTAQSDLYFAENVVKTLYRWCIDWTIPLPLMQPYFASVIPQLDSFLRGNAAAFRERSTVVTDGIVSKKGKKDMDLDGAVLDRVRLIVLDFLGALGGKYNHFVLEATRLDETENAAVAWDMEKHMNFKFPFSDVILSNFFLDDLLPRVIDLAMHCPDRRTKVAACEALHAMTVTLVGNHAFMPDDRRSKSTLLNLIQKLMPKLLELACDAEPIAKQIFEPLLLQIIHWYSRKSAMATKESAAVLECVMEGLISERNPVVRDFSARCAQEYLEWSLKDTRPGEMSVATRSLLEKIISFASHSSAAKRFGAGLAFSRCYRIFRENPMSVDIFTIDLVVTFTKSLAIAHRDNAGMGTEKLMESCLEHLEKIVGKYVKKLQKPTTHRRRPADLEEATVEHLIKWLFLQSCRPEMACRMKSWTLLEAVIRTSQSSSNAASFFDDLKKTQGLSWLLRTFLNGGFTAEEDNHLLTVEAVQSGLDSPGECLHTLERLAAAVDCFAWALREAYINPGGAAKTVEWNKLFQMIGEFMERIGSRSCVLFSSEDSVVQRMKCTLLIRITDLIIYVLMKYGKEGRISLPVNLWNEDFLSATASLILNPAAMGFDLSDPEVKSGLNQQVRAFLSALTGSLEPKTIRELGETIGKLMVQPKYDIPLWMDSEIDNFLFESYAVLRDSRLDFRYLESKGMKDDPKTFGLTLLDIVDERLKRGFKACGSRLESWLTTSVRKEQQLFLLALSYMDGINEIVGKYFLGSTDRDIFYPKVKRPFFKYIFDLNGKHAVAQGKFLELIFRHKQLKVVNEIIRDCLEYVVSYRAFRKQNGPNFCAMVVQYLGSFLDIYIKTFSSIEDYRIPLENLKLLLFIDSGILKQSSPEISKVMDFYVSVLTRDVASDQSIVSVKNYALRLLPFFLSAADVHRVEEAIQMMYVNDFPVTAAEISSDATRRAYYLQAVDLLLNAVPLNDNRVLLEVCVKIICRDQNHPLVDRFDQMFQSICSMDRGEHTQDMMDIPWKIFVNVQYAVEHREIAVDKVLLPMIRSTSQSALMEFFARHVEKICELLEMKPRVPTLGLTIEQKCCLELMEIFCSRTPKADLFSAVSLVSKSFAKYRAETDGKPIANPTGKELIQFLTRTADGLAHENVAVNPELKEARRTLHCAAYKVLAAAVTATQTELRFYHRCLFEEKPETGRILWSNLVDVDTVYEFPVEFIKSPERRELLAAVHKEMTDETDSNSSLTAGIFTMTSYMSARASAASLIQASSLGEEIGRFDYSTGMDRRSIPLSVLEENATRKSKESVILEMNDLNLNECMATLVAIVQMMAGKGISPKSGPTPDWVVALKQKIQNPIGHLNVKLFIAKLIVNVENSKQPFFVGFADDLYAPLVDLISNIPNPDGLNYFTVDLVETMLKWTLTSPPRMLAQSAAQNLFIFILKNVPHKNSQVQKNNLTLLKVMAEAWRSLLTSPAKNVVSSLLTNDPAQAKSNLVVISIIAVILHAKLPLNSGVFDEFQRVLILHMKTASAPVYRASALAFGLLITRAEEDEVERARIESAVLEADKKLDQLYDEQKPKNQPAAEMQFMVMLREFHKSCPRMVGRHLRRILNIFPQLSGEKTKTICLEILNSSTFDNPFLEFRVANIDKCFTDRNESVQGLVVQLYRTVSARLTTKDFIELLDWMKPLCSHPSPILRQQVYDFCMRIYERFESASNTDEKRVLQAARVLLTSGLTDKDKIVRNNLFTFWAQDRRFSGSTFVRLMTIFKTFLEPEVQSTFLSSACHLLLELSAKTPQFGLPVFPSALSDCEFFKQEIETTWRGRSSMMPVTASTYAGGTFSGTFGSARVGQRAPVFTPTQIATVSAMDSLASSGMHTYGSQFSEALMVEMPSRNLFGGSGDAYQISQEDRARFEQEQTQKELNSIRRRVQRDKQDASLFFAKRALTLQKQLEESLKKERERRDLEVKLSRMYRVGEVPDVMITHSAIIQPLQTLTQLDPHTAGLLLIRLFHGIIQESKKRREIVDSELDKVVERLEKIFDDERVSDVTFLTSMLNIVISDETRLLGSVSARSIGSAAVKSQQPHLGIAVLETALLKQTSEPSAKRGVQKASDYWLNVFKLLQNVGDTDSTQGVRLEDVFSRADNVRLALDAEIRGDLNAAMSLYAELYTSEDGSDQSVQLLQESYMRCLNSLANWNDLEAVSLPESKLDEETMDRIWKEPFFTDVAMPYAVQSLLKLTLENHPPSIAILKTFFDTATANAQRKDILERRFALPAGIFCIQQKQPQHAEYYLKLASRSFLENWAGTPQLNLYSRRKYLPLMQLINEARRSVVVQKKCELYPDNERNLKESFMNYLVDDHREPSDMDSVGVWNDLIVNRCFFVRNMAQSSLSKAADAVESFVVHENLKVATSAVRHHNFRVSDQIMKTTVSIMKNIPDSEYYASPDLPLKRLQDRWGQVYISGALERASFYCTADEAEKNLVKLFDALRLAEKAIPNADPSSKAALKVTVCRLRNTIVSVVIECDGEMELDNKRKAALGLQKDDISGLYPQIFEDLRISCQELPEHPASAEYLLEEFRFCDGLVGRNVIADVQLVECGTAALLRAMKLGSVAARGLFSRLLVWITEHPQIVDGFRKGCKDIPVWMFLSWTNQMLALVDKKEGIAVHDILVRLADAYPQAMVYGFRISKEGYVFEESKSGEVNRKACDRLSQILNLPLVNEFIRNLELLYPPHSFFADFAKKAELMVKDKKNDLLKREFEEIYGKVLAEDAVSSLNPTWKNFIKDSREKILTLFGTAGKKIPKLKYSQFKADKVRFEEWLKDQAEKNKNEDFTKLSQINPWLTRFTSLNYEESLEIPGQYSGQEKPILQHHVKITSFGEEIMTLPSIRRPIRIMIRGNDEKDHLFLVKGGEDLRLDQRIEQLFELMNRVFEQDADCWKRNLKITTYKVVPMTTQVGLIEWVPNTTSLKGFLSQNQPKELKIDESFSVARDDFRQNLVKMVASALKKKKDDVTERTAYQQSYGVLDPSDMPRLFRKSEQKIEPYLLRSQLEKLTVSPDAFVMIRNIFVETYATFSIAQYILGIGDRHLSNVLISTANGSIFPIDFGHAFGSAVQFLPIPELVPIRLTRQLVNLVAPLSVAGKFKQIMILALRALRKQQQILLATMNVFIQEPSVDWLHNARKSAPSGDSPVTDDLRWFPRDKIAIAQRKLQGGNPAYITRDELHRSVLVSGEILAQMEKACLGSADSLRSKQPEMNLAVDVQVDCLIDQAQDANLLSRMYWGWEPWV